MGRIRVVIYGVGAIGRMVARTICEKREEFEIVGAIDLDERKVGSDLGVLADLGREVGVKVSAEPDRVLKETTPDIAIIMTTSFLNKVFPQIMTCVKFGVNVISTCEELAYPYIVNKELSRKMDEAAKAKGVRILGTGINPGFLMDVLPLFLTTPCIDVNAIEVTRVIDASKRREPFQRKIGVRLSVDDFRRSIEQGKITGHVGLVQSIALIADALQWSLDKIEVKKPAPVVAPSRIERGYIPVPAGFVAGLEQKACGIVGGETKISLTFRASLIEDEDYDRIRIDGTPPINLEIKPCVHGDQGTVGVIINLIPTVLSSKPGLLTMIDLLRLHYCKA